ncbi:MAG TPA: hypothetical protein VIW28_00195, partial [Gemmatimonadales bacterium]
VGGRRLTPPVPFDTAKALRRVSMSPGLARGVRVPGVRSTTNPGRKPGVGSGPFADDPPPGPAPPGGVVTPPADTFPHDRHKSLSCITCHVSTREHGRLTFQPPRGCQICHHQAPRASDCAACHRPAELVAPESVTVRVVVAGRPERRHLARFGHTTHQEVRCVACHTTPVTLDPEPKAATCVACHEDHHAAAKQCAACHTGDDAERRAAHAPPVEAHVACDACHATATVARLVPDRPLCLSCHVKQRDHYADRECTGCHFQSSPETFRNRLRKAAAGR